jgi:cell division protein FtsZ
VVQITAIPSIAQMLGVNRIIQGRAVPNPVGDPSLTLEEAKNIVGRVSEALDPEAHVIWGAQISDELKNTVRVMVILSGVHSPYVLAPGERPAPKKEKGQASTMDLGLEFLK